MDNVISAEIVFANVKQMLKSYEAAGLINDADLFRWTQWVINFMGIGHLKERELVLDVEDYKATMPEDFALLWVAHKCDSKFDDDGEATYRWYMPEQRFVLRDWVSKVCYSDCDARRDEETFEVTRIVELETKQSIKQHFCNRTLMSFNKRVSKTGRCHSQCKNLYNNSQWNFNFDDKFMYLNFKKGYVHLQYYAHLHDEDGYPMIVNNTLIKQAVEDYLIYKCFQMIYYNNESDVQQRMIYAEQKYQQSLKEALMEQKLPSFSRLIEYSKLVPKSLEQFNLASLADKPIDNCKHGLHRQYQRTQY